MTASSFDQRLAVAGLLLQFSDDVHDLNTRVVWALSPMVAACMSPAERQAVTAAHSDLTRLRDELAALAAQREAEVAAA
ncbi:MAG: hypothetical protein WCF98_08345 [Synechococcus sp. ELA057]|jgi:hypothetical protein